MRKGNLKMDKKNFIVDRIEGGFAVVEYGADFLRVPVSDILGQACEGDVLVKNGEKFSVDKTATDGRREKIRGLEDSLWK